MSYTKSIIIFMPYTNGISTAIIHSFKKNNFDVYDFVLSDATFKYKNIFQKLYNLYRKIIHNDTTFKDELKKQTRVEGFSKRLENIPQADYALFIRPDLIPKELIDEVKTKAKKTIGYQWDGLNRFPQIFNYINCFDRFFTFDYKDIDIGNGILPITNFFIPAKNKPETKKTMIYFVGIYDDYRFNLLERLKKQVPMINSSTNLFFISKNQKVALKLKKSNYTLIEEIDYSKNLLLSQEAKVLIDIVVSTHSGLSFRVFEALGYEIKLITNNKAVKEYDFYHPNNIFIWDDKNENEIIDFLESEYVTIDENIKNKYSFNNWANYLLDTGNYTSIDVPKA